MSKTAAQKVKYLVLAMHAALNDGEIFEYADLSGDEIDEAYQHLADAGEEWDALCEVRAGDVETGLQCEWSRHYESKAVAAQLPDGSWVGWTYWYGGGKHANPEAIDWIDDVYDLTCEEQEKVVTVRTFSKAEGRSHAE